MLPQILELKRRRRVHLGSELTFLFENHATLRYQIQEMIRVERLEREADIHHELETYNALLARAGELACTLLIEVEAPAERAEKLRRWRDLPGHLYLRLADDRRIPATFDPGQRDATRLSSVQFLRFRVGDQVPVAVGCDFPGLSLEVRLTQAQRDALAEDLAAAGLPGEPRA